jgi:hypothetical protein
LAFISHNDLVFARLLGLTSDKQRERTARFVVEPHQARPLVTHDCLR